MTAHKRGSVTVLVHPEKDSFHWHNVAPNPNGPLHESRTGFSPGAVRTLRRKDSHEYVASSAITRLQHIDTYNPTNLRAYLDGEHHVMPVDLEFRGPTGSSVLATA